MTHTVTVSYYDDGPAIVSEYPNADEAHEAYVDVTWAAVYGPKGQVGDIRAVTLREGERVVKTRAW
jgi:hypothetical protein